MSGANGDSKGALYGRILKEGNALLAPVFLRVEVLQKYHETAAYSVVRTDTIGRLRRPGAWMIDFGIAEDEQTIDVTLDDLMHRLPEAERAHWIEHIVTPALSGNFVKAKLSPITCIEDGELRQF